MTNTNHESSNDSSKSRVHRKGIKSYFDQNNVSKEDQKTAISDYLNSLNHGGDGLEGGSSS